MRVRVRLLGSLKPANMRSGIEVEFPAGASLTTLIEEIAKQYHEMSGALGSPAGTLMMIDGVEAGNLRGLDTLLSDGSEVVLVPVTHGG